MRRVEAVDVKRGIRLGVAELLGVLEDDVKGKALILHAREDVVARAVEDAVDRLGVIARETLAQHADDRNAAADRGTEIDVDVVGLRRLENLLAVLGEQLLVRRHNTLLRVERIQDKLLRNARAADRFDDDLNLRVGDRRRRVRRQNARRNRNATIRRNVEICDLLENDVDVQALGHDVMMLQETVRDARAHGSKTQNANSDLLHLMPFFL